jgi:hypothetical protein
MKDKKKPYKPFPLGTVRGPFRCGHGNFITGHNQGVQFCVNDETNGWHYFIGKFTEEGKLRRAAFGR